MSLTGQHVIHLLLLPIALRPIQFDLGFQHVIHSKPKIILAILSYWQHCFSFYAVMLLHNSRMTAFSYCSPVSWYTESLPSGKDTSCLVMCAVWNKTQGNRIRFRQRFGLMHTYYSKMKCYLVIGQISLHYILKHEIVVYSA
jgi:hypothetical protein